MKLYILLVLAFITGTGHAQRSDSLTIQFLREAGVNISHNNSVKLLPSGKAKFNDLFQAIDTARHHIHMEYFNFRNDSIAGELFNRLAVKAAQGVEVRLMFDAFGNWSNNKPLNKNHLKAIRRAGIEIVKFDPINFPYVNHIFHRDHRKIVVIDGKVGYTGGMNVADYYVNGLPEIGDWRDMHIRLQGESVADLQKIFFSIWNKETKQDIGGEAYFPQQQEEAKQGNDKTIAIVDRAPKSHPKLLRRAFVTAIESARNDIQIVNPYFVPTRSVKKALKKAIDRGVNVEIMISSKSDIGFTPDASKYVTYKLMKRGAHVFLFDNGFHHSKVMMIDHSFCTVGSTNLNSRSLRYDYETNAFIFNRETTGELIRMFDDDKEDCTVMTQELWKQRSRWKRFVGWFAHLFTPVL